jgi:hypothetical protein
LSAIEPPEQNPATDHPEQQTVDRTYLFVPPEEKAEVQSLGAHWDAATKRWYIGPESAPAGFSRWLPSAADEDEVDNEFPVTSSDAYVAAATVPCEQCHADIEVICIHCATGEVSGEPLTHFTLSDVQAMDEELIQQLRHWPTFRRSTMANGKTGDFVNHCPHCNAPQDDLYLHSEPDSPFFAISRAAPGSIKLTSLVGTIHLTADEHFTVD